MSADIKIIKGVKTIRLINVGWVPVKKIEDFRSGDKIAYNYGSYGIVIGKKKVTPKFWELVTRYNGKTYKQRIKVGTYKPFYR